MKKSFIALAIILASVTFFSSHSDIVVKTNGYTEENNLWIGINDKNTNTMTEEEFNKILDRVEEIYAPIVRSQRKRLVVQRRWEDGTVNAYASQRFGRMIITMFGGLARHEKVTADGFALVACHEMAHHLGGKPQMGNFMARWASVEGQADYWASLKCMRKYMEQDDNIAMVANMNVPAFATKQCEANFSNAEDVAICQRNTMAGLSLANLLSALRNLSTLLSLETPDPRVVEETRDLHPEPQCRLDSYFAGSICEIDAYTDVDDRDETIGVCSRQAGHDIQARPLCWYKPRS